jgi:hypothetical protein
LQSGFLGGVIIADKIQKIQRTRSERPDSFSQMHKRPGAVKWHPRDGNKKPFYWPENSESRKRVFL